MMFEIPYPWLPLIALAVGLVLGAVIFSLIRQSYYQKIQKQNLRLQKQLKETEQKTSADHEQKSEIIRLKSELDRIKQDINILSKNDAEIHKNLTERTAHLEAKVELLQSSMPDLTNIILERSNLKKKEKKQKDYSTAYKQFLEELETTIKSARASAFNSGAKSNKIKDNKKGKLKKKKQLKKMKSDFKIPEDFKRKIDSFKPKKQAPIEQIIEDISAEEIEDDLTKLFGIDETAEHILKQNGIESYEDLARSRIADLRAMLRENDLYDQYNPLNWPVQARLAEKEQWDILNEFNESMKGKSTS